MKKQPRKTLVLGLGNPILSDDGAGCRVAAALKEKENTLDVEVMEAGIANLDLIDLLSGYEKVIIIDAIQTKRGKPGKIYRFGPNALANTRHAGNPHAINIATAIELGKKLKIKMPQEIIIFAIEAEDVNSFSEECTPAVSKAVPECVDMVMRELES